MMVFVNRVTKGQRTAIEFTLDRIFGHSSTGFLRQIFDIIDRDSLKDGFHHLSLGRTVDRFSRKNYAHSA